ncbi:MAG TPA: hypothetical protein VJX94_05865 [Stellaceae bacterium]|nr:hypothetical protein [Stellaceae bacterium]
MGAPSAATLRMRKSRERRRQGDMIVKLEIGPNMTTDLVALDWLATPDRVDKDALARVLVGLINRAITMRVTPSTGLDGVSVMPMRATAGPIAIGSDENARQLPRLATLGERDRPHGLGLGRVQPGEVLGAADGAAEVVEDKPPEVQPFDGVDTPDIAAEQAEISRLKPSEAQPSAEAIQPLEVDPAQLWDQRLALWLRWRMWMSQWGPRPDQDGCLVPDYLL